MPQLALSADDGSPAAPAASAAAAARLPVRVLTIRPAVHVTNLTGIPLRLAACGFPFFRRLAPCAPAGAPPPAEAATELLRWQSDDAGHGGGGGGDYDEAAPGARRP